MDYFNNDEFDEFDEFRNFNREELNKLFRQRMEDDEFRKKFMGIVGGYQRDYDSIIKLFNHMGYNPFSGLSSYDNIDRYFGPSKGSFLKDLDFTGFNEDGWNGEHWVSPDGRTHISSFTRSMTPEEFYEMDRKSEKDLPTEYVIELLQKKLKNAISDENYEEAANIRDTIKSLETGEKTKKEDKSKK